MTIEEIDNVVCKLLNADRVYGDWYGELRGVGLDMFDDPLDNVFVTIALDLLGVPDDNTVETCACEIASETGEWPKAAFCRDWCYDTFDEMCLKNGDVDGFIAAIRDAVKFWAKEGIVR